MANAPYYAEGDYQATIVSHTFAKGQYGTQLLLGIEPQVEVQAYPRTIYLPFLDDSDNPDKNIERTIAALKSIGYCDSPSRLDANSDNPASLVGTEIAVTCKYSKTTGKDNWYLKFTTEPVSKQTLKKLDSLFGKELQGNKPATAPPAKTAKTPLPPDKKLDADIDAANAELGDAAGDDSIPF